MYVSFVSAVKAAHAAMSRRGGPHQQHLIMREFLVFERDLCFRQFHTGVSWDLAFDMFEFMGLMVRLVFMLQTPPPPALPPAAAPAGGKGGNEGGKVGAAGGAAQAAAASDDKRPCYAFDRNSSCKFGAKCPYAKQHRCFVCSSTEHGMCNCPSAAHAVAPAAAAAQ